MNRRERRVAARESKKAANSPVIARSNRREADDLCSLGLALKQQGRHQEAFKAFDQAVQLCPGEASFWASRADVLANLNRSADSLSSYERALKLDPHHRDAAFACGLLQLKLARPDEAVSYFDLCERLQPNQPAVLEHRAMAMHNLGRFEEALADGQRAHAIDPTNSNVCNNIGAALSKLRRNEEALPWFDKALALRPDYVNALTNKAYSLTEMLRIDQAVTIYEHVRRIYPDYADAELNLSHLHLLTGNFEAGWVGLEARWKIRFRPMFYPNFSQPMWRGEADIQGKTILVYMDEGIGDAIQFARYVPMLSARGARVILAVADVVYPLLSALPDVSECVPKSVPSLPAFDLHCPMMSLPLAFGTRPDTIPSNVPYLPSPPDERQRAWEDRLQSRLGPRSKLRVGLAWSGNPNHLNDLNRSIALRTLLGLIDADATFISLQKDPRPDDKALLGHTDIIDLTSDLSDLAETAALVGCLDLVITVDTSIAHLAGALGCPTWILLPFRPDWRWLLDRDDTPWYPTARLFRQQEKGDWSDVITRVRNELGVQILSGSQ